MSYMTPAESSLFRSYELEREAFEAHFLRENDATAREAADEAFAVENFGDRLVDFARCASRELGGTPADHISGFCDDREDGSFLKACAMLRLHRVEAAQLGQAA